MRVNLNRASPAIYSPDELIMYLRNKGCSVNVKATRSLRDKPIVRHHTRIASVSHRPIACRNAPASGGDPGAGPRSFTRAGLRLTVLPVLANLHLQNLL